MSLRLRFGPRDFRIIERESAFKGYFQVVRLTLTHRQFAGGWSDPIVREVFERGNAVGVLPWDPWQDRIILIEQFRPGALRDASSPWMLELVAGIIEPGESDEDVVYREAMEEAGCELDALVPMVSYYPSAGACTEHVRLFCGRVRSAAVGDVCGVEGEGEDILVHSVPRAEVFRLLDEDRIPNGHTLVALQWLRIHGDALRERWCGEAARAPS